MTTATASRTSISFSGTEPKQPFPLVDLAQCFDLGRWQSVRWLPRGRNEHAQIATDHSTYFLRRSHSRKTWESVQWQVELLSTLRRHDLPVPEPLPCNGGGSIATIDERLYTVTEILPGTPFDEAQPAHAAAMGRMLARFHSVGPEAALGQPEANSESILDSLREDLAEAEAKDHPETFARAKEVEARLAALSPALPVALLHRGCRRRNVLFTGAEITGLLDFDSARAGPRVLDVAGALLDVSKVHTEAQRKDHKVALDLPSIRVFLEGYREIALISPLEVEAIPVLMGAKRACDALGSLAKLRKPDADDDDRHKARLEEARLVWLIEHGEALRAVMQ